MKQISTLWLPFFFFSVCLNLSAQISFTNQSQLLQNPNFFSGVAIGIADMNNDGLDDIVHLNQAHELNIELQIPDSLHFVNFYSGNTSSEGEWSISIGDVNNDGLNDILTGGAYNQVKVLTALGDGTGYVMKNLPGPDIFLQGSNFVDINNDGFVDVFGCHDDGESRIWGNDGTGNFVTADNWIDMQTVPSSDNSGNYGSLWTDFDNDDDLDLYIAKCRLGVTNPNDPRRINALYRNDGNHNFEEKAADYGLKIKSQSWTSEFQDIDNDGDLDCFIANHDAPALLLENDGTGNYTEISEAAGVAVSGYFLQGSLRDFDNDGFMDILTASPANIYRNNGDKTFTKVNGLFGGAEIKSYAIGDLNQDGFLDLYASFAEGINNPSTTPDELWMNDGNANNFLAVRLEGTQSNKQGIGARIELHGEWGIQIREVRSGESYGISTSLTKRFGICKATEISYLVVRWPSGNIDVIQNPAPNQLLTVVEKSTCRLDDFELTTNGNPVICPGESVELIAPAGFAYLWSDGTSEQNISITAAGNFRVLLVDTAGCVAASNVVRVLANPDETPTITASAETAFCEGDTLILTSSEAASYAWSTGDSTQSITVAETGNYQVTIQGVCGDFTSQTVSVEVLPTPPPPLVKNDTLFEPGTAQLTATGIDPHWYDSPEAIEALASGASFTTPFIEETTTFYVEDVVSNVEDSYSTGMPAHAGTLFSGNDFNGAIIFDVQQPIRLKIVDVITDTPGPRLIELRNAEDAVLESKMASLEIGETELELNFDIQPGNNYQLTTNAGVNNQTFGFNSPRMERSDDSVFYPYVLEGILSIKDSNFGSGFYYYFYDWQVEPIGITCLSERIPVDAVLLPTAVFDPVVFEKLTVLPNPSSGAFTLEIQSVINGDAELSVFNLMGKKIFGQTIRVSKNSLELHEFDLSAFAKGVYVLQIKNGDKLGWEKLFLQ